MMNDMSLFTDTADRSTSGNPLLFPWLGYFKNTKLIINSGLVNTSNYYDHLIKILSTNFPDTVPVEFYATGFKNCTVKQFSKFIDTIFE